MAEATAKNRVYGQLEVALGDDVLVRVPGIQTSISGSTMFNWSGEPIPVADGVYNLNGTVKVYGPVLNIDNGTISFPGVPANNPLLNIRAEREVFGNTQIRSAGVQVIDVSDPLNLMSVGTITMFGEGNDAAISPALRWVRTGGLRRARPSLQVFEGLFVRGHHPGLCSGLNAHVAHRHPAFH